MYNFKYVDLTGVCSCYDGYTDDDCSKEISAPPSGISLPSNGVCTLGTRKCKRTNVFGDFPSTSVWYQLKYFQVWFCTVVVLI